MNNIIQLFESFFNEKVDDVEVLPPSGSYREYCRLKSRNRTAIGAYNADIKENEAFFSFTANFLGNKIPVPEIYVIGEKRTFYLLEDLGNTTLFDFIGQYRQSDGFSESIINEYKKVLRQLPKIQVVTGKEVDFSVCYPRAAFDKQSMMWDLNYFKYYFLKLAKIPFDEQALEDDFQAFSDYLLTADNNYFLFRDFQSRNVMLKNNKVYFIDYQGGRKGALQYDLASLLYDGKADMPQEIRGQLFKFYLKELKKLIEVDSNRFKQYFNGFVLIRIMQAMGAYGFRGFYEKKEHFLKSIPYALKNLDYILNGLNLPVEIPEMVKVLKGLSGSPVLKKIGASGKGLTIRITSFSYKKGIPTDPSGNGGGFVFDCRALENPGRYAEYKELTGRDKEVKKFIETKTEMADFLDTVKSVIKRSVEKYLERGFTHLVISFGCTGGQHRSVYAADMISQYLKNNFPVDVVLLHRELE
ncbi:MAG: phosphotransferase [Prolixibacteraceae bacterium]|nr:phosphotransferase [Prolixibacteraceae bacterium]